MEPRLIWCARHCLLAHPDLPRDDVSRWGVEVGNDHASPLHAARRLGPRPRNIDQRTALVPINRKRNDASCSNHRFPPAMPPLLTIYRVNCIHPYNISIIWNLCTSWRLTLSALKTEQRCRNPIPPMPEGHVRYRARFLAYWSSARSKVGAPYASSVRCQHRSPPFHIRSPNFRRRTSHIPDIRRMCGQKFLRDHLSA